MKWTCILVVTLLGACLCACDALPAPVATEPLAVDLAAMQGEWRVSHAEIAGRVLPESAIAHLRFQFASQSVRHNYRSGRTVQFRLCPDSHINFLDTGTEAGIYRIEGDQLTICSAPPGAARPTRFATSKNDRNMLWILQRNPTRNSR